MSVGKQLWSSLFKETSPLNALPSNALADSRLFTNSRENTHEAQERYSNAIKDPIRDESPPFLLASQDEQSLLTDTLQGKIPWSHRPRYPTANLG